MALRRLDFLDVAFGEGFVEGGPVFPERGSTSTVPVCEKRVLVLSFAATRTVIYVVWAHEKK